MPEVQPTPTPHDRPSHVTGPNVVPAASAAHKEFALVPVQLTPTGSTDPLIVTFVYVLPPSVPRYVFHEVHAVVGVPPLTNESVHVFFVTIEVHVPALQYAPVVHFTPHAPQLLGSYFVSTHAVPHFVVPPAHTSVHVPETHVAPPVHVVPHAPQFFGSLTRSRHDPVQSVRPVGHVSLQVPKLHTSPAAHFFPHVPQLLRSP